MEGNSTGNVILATFTDSDPAAQATDFTANVNWGGTLIGTPAVAVQLVGDRVDSTVNNPIEAVEHWRAGKLRPVCVFDSKKLD